MWCTFSSSLVRPVVLVVGTLLLCAGSLFAQDLSPDEKQKLGLRLQPVVETTTAKTTGASPGPIAAKPFRGGDAFGAKAAREPTYAVFVHTSDPEAVASTGASVDSRFSDFVTARATASQLRAIAQLESVEQVRASGRAQLNNDEAAAFVGARPLNNGLVEGTEYTGDGVIACVIDSGIDYDHPDFVDDDGNSRIISIWDQTFDTDGQTPYDRHSGLFSNQGAFDYGTEYHTPEIESGGLSTGDTNGHGTHVAGTVGASGNADGAGKYKGMAPGVNYIIVRPGAYGNIPETNWVNGLNFCDQIAEQEGMPMVANLSFGTQNGPHDGTSSRATAVDEVLQDGSASGRAVVVSAGNAGGKEIHTSTSIAASTSGTVSIDVPSYTAQSGSGNDSFYAQLWFDRDLDATATVTTPNGATVTVAPDETENDTTAGDGAVVVGNDVYAGNGDRYVEIVAVDPTASNTPTSGTWTVELQNNSSSSATVNGWMVSDRIGIGSQLIEYGGGDTQSTVGIPGTATHAITVGSFMHRWRWYGADGSENRSPVGNNRSGEISNFSSEGPRRDGTGGAYKPEITAPGQHVISSLSQDASASASKTSPGGMHVKKQGTSMSSPVVAGSIALLLEEDPSLTSQEIKDLITQTADSDSYTGSVPNPEWGYGRLNILDAMTQLVNSSGSATYSVKTNDLHPDKSYEGFFKLGGDGDAAHAVRFQPQQQSRLSGAYFHLDSPSANNLSDSLVVEIRRDDGGTPGARIGEPVQVSPNRLRVGTWNYQSLLDTDTELSAGQDYYLVYYPSNPNDVLYLMGENYDASGNTLYLSSETWTEDSNFDVLVRPVVSSLSGVEALPVEIVTFRAQVIDQSATLRWRTASETGNARFDIQRKRQRGDWKTVGRVDGAGTTTKPQRYEYRISKLPYGKHQFRLRQVDLDGTTHYSSETEAVVSPPQGISVNTSPNPISTNATVRIATGQAQEISVEVYDMLGRQVARVYDGNLTPERPEVLNLDGSMFSSGTYFLRVRGERTATTKRVTVIR